MGAMGAMESHGGFEWENHGKNKGKQWEYHGKTMGISWIVVI